MEAGAWLIYGWRLVAGMFLVWALAILVALLVREPRATAPLGFVLCAAWLLGWSVRSLLR
jgi:hypothetical protein